jgi:flagellar motor switch protein FliN/FliY
MKPEKTSGQVNLAGEFPHLADLALEIEAELDRIVLSMRQVLVWEAGSVITLTRSAGENIDIRIGGSLVASGEIVVIESLLGVRITDFNMKA